MTSYTPTKTPSKAPTSIDTPPRPPPSSTIDSPLTTAMRQAGFEAAKKAGDAKKSSSAKIVAQAKGSEQSSSSSETLRKLDNSAPTGTPPSSGITGTRSAMAPETGSSTVESKADGVPETTTSSNKVTDSMQDLSLTEANAANSRAAGLTGGPAGTGEDKNLEKKTSIGKGPKAEVKEAEEDGLDKGNHESARPKTGMLEPEEREAESGAEEDAGNTKDVTAASDEVQNLPGKKTQDQPAASGENAGSSVAD